MEPVEIDRVDAQVVKAFAEIERDIVGGDAVAPVTSAQVHERTLGGDDQTIAAARLEPCADSAFAGAFGRIGCPVAIRAGGVDEVAAQFDIAIQNSVGFFLIQHPAQHIGAVAKLAHRQVGVVQRDLRKHRCSPDKISFCADGAIHRWLAQSRRNLHDHCLARKGEPDE